jgi:DNA-binding transcriptional regulator GbsR (MarR family)
MASVNKEELIEMYLRKLMSIPEISLATGVSMSTIRLGLLKLGILRSRADSMLIASSKGKLGSGNRGKRRIFTQAWKNNISKGRQLYADKNALGICTKQSGYIEFTRGNNKGRSQHVVAMENKIERRIGDNDVVHHIDGDRSNNCINNLRLMTRSEHARLHAIENINKRMRCKNGKFM